MSEAPTTDALADAHAEAAPPDASGSADGPKPKEYTADELEEYVKMETRAIAEKQDASKMAFKRENKGNTDDVERELFDGTAKEVQGGVRPESFKTGRWYKFLNFDQSCFVYVHNLTRDITAVRPENFTEPTAEELERERKKGLPLQLLEPELAKCYSRKKIPVVYCNEQTQEKIRTFMSYGRGHVVETGLLTRISEFALEKARQEIVNAMRYGKYLVIEIPGKVCDFQEKVCVRKWEAFFPVELFTFRGCDDNNSVKKKIYRPDDIEANQCVVRKGFQVILTLAYDSQNFAMSSMRMDELRNKVPNFDLMEVVRCRG
ncbi:unnamed protein product [Amoebophrya sp. A25]|nr:unnamed protein product [Amoebophrya sp. A25]|eukprot:GSA25T00002867001.1